MKEHIATPSNLTRRSESPGDTAIPSQKRKWRETRRTALFGVSVERQKRQKSFRRCCFPCRSPFRWSWPTGRIRTVPPKPNIRPPPRRKKENPRTRESSSRWKTTSRRGRWRMSRAKPRFPNSRARMPVRAKENRKKAKIRKRFTTELRGVTQSEE